MKKRIRTIIGIIVGIIIGVSTTVGATTIFNSKDITYSNSATSKTNVKDSLDELYNKAANVEQCPDGKWCIDNKIENIVEIGDYIKMTPTSTSYTIFTSLTGYTSTQTINPSELNLWRVIRKNDDGTIDVVSEYVSSKGVYFEGETGYLKFVGTLNRIAAQYTNTKYVSKTRHMGYNGQTENCTKVDTTRGECISDTLYEIDKELVKSSLLTFEAKKPSGESSGYWIASRELETGYGTMYKVRYAYGTYVEIAIIYNSRGGGNGSAAQGIRPILTFKSGIPIKSGDGKSASTAYKLI